MELRCIRCQRPSQDWHCQSCGPDVRVDVLWSKEAVDSLELALGQREDRGCWRYRELLPVHLSPALRLPETPLLDAPRLASE